MLDAKRAMAGRQKDMAVRQKAMAGRQRAMVGRQRVNGVSRRVQFQLHNINPLSLVFQKTILMISLH